MEAPARQASLSRAQASRSAQRPRRGAQVKLTSSDAQMFEVDEEVANESVTIKNMIEGERLWPRGGA
jgi:hypothetical protein